MAEGCGTKEYVEREWTRHELKSAIARGIQQRGREYILPIRVDAVELPGVAPTIGYVDLGEHDVDEIAALLVKKLRAQGIMPRSRT